MYCIKLDNLFLNNKLQKVNHITKNNGLLFESKEEAEEYIKNNLNDECKVYEYG